MSDHVFISYARQDQAYVARLAAFLESAGISTWHDFNISAGQSFGAEIQRTIETCRALVVVLSTNSLASEWVQREIYFGIDRRKQVLPIRIDHCPIPIFVANLHCENPAPNSMPSVQFISRLRNIVDGPPDSDPSGRALPTGEQPSAASTVPPDDAPISSPTAQVTALQMLGELMAGPALSLTTLAEAERLAGRVTRQSTRDVMFSSIAERLAAQDADRALHVARSIIDHHRRRKTLNSIAAVLATSDMQRAHEVLAEVSRLDNPAAT